MVGWRNCLAARDVTDLYIIVMYERMNRDGYWEPDERKVLLHDLAKGKCFQLADDPRRSVPFQVKQAIINDVFRRKQLMAEEVGTHDLIPP